MAESVHDKLKRVRKPRVHITYEVETGDATVVKELPCPHPLSKIPIPAKVSPICSILPSGRDRAAGNAGAGILRSGC